MKRDLGRKYREKRKVSRERLRTPRKILDKKTKSEQSKRVKGKM